MRAGTILRLLRQVPLRLLLRLVRLGWRSEGAIRRFAREAERGRVVPPFLFLSVTSRCNLRCRGCWIPSESPHDMPAELLEHLLGEAESMGSPLVGILGGEPLLREDLFDALARHSSPYYLLFTNGILLDDAAAARMAALGNVTPLVSLEAPPERSDERRGGREVHRRTLAGLEAARRHGLFTGVSTSLSKANLDAFLSASFLRELADLGVHYLWYYIYRPVGPDPAPELALEEEEILRFRRFLVEARRDAPLLLLDAYWDAEGRALCPAATGISVHIGPDGDLEPCPPMQFSRDRIRPGDDLAERLASSSFLAATRRRLAAGSRGCILLEDPAGLATFLAEEEARPTSGRDGFAELCAACPRAGHDLAGREIPERDTLTRFAKKRWFFGFGAYG